MYMYISTCTHVYSSVLVIFPVQATTDYHDQHLCRLLSKSVYTDDNEPTKIMVLVVEGWRLMRTHTGPDGPAVLRAACPGNAGQNPGTLFFVCI